jgi:uncharacterized protein
MEDFSSLIAEYDLSPYLVEYVSLFVLPLYKEFDSAHNVEHATTVIKESLKLSVFYEVDRNMVFTIAAYHDTGQINGRENHNIDSGKIVVKDKRLGEWFTPAQIEIMKEAVEDHRASIDHEPRSIYGKIVAEADRIIDPITTLTRAVRFGKEHFPDYNREQHLERAFKHVIEKYSTKGYLKLWIPESENAKKLEELRLIIDDKKRLFTILEDIYDKFSFSGR